MQISLRYQYTHLQAAEIRFLRSVTGMARRDNIKNDDIRNKLHVESLNDTVSKYKENYNDNV
jgi:hypothetical protein